MAVIPVVTESVKPFAQPVEQPADKLVAVGAQSFAFPSSAPLDQNATPDEFTITDNVVDSSQNATQQAGTTPAVSQAIETKATSRFVAFLYNRLVWAIVAITLLVGLWLYTLLPANPTIGSTWQDATKEIMFVYVPAGKFIMGSDEGAGDEKPAHEVMLDAFWIMQTEVTNAQYKKCVDAGVCTKPGNAEWGKTEFLDNFSQHPVIYVTWDQANTYANWVGGRLPTEAEWEKAARGPDGNVYPWGIDPPNDERLNYNRQVGATTEVGYYPKGKSVYGVFDMAGNVWEWVADWYAAAYYKNSSTENPPGPPSGDFHVVRGGAWYTDASGVRSSRRGGDGGRGDHVGFRVVRVVSPGL